MKFTAEEDQALHLLRKHGPLRPGERFKAWKAAGLVKALDRLERKGLVESEETDDGPRYSLTSLGEADAA
jgi:DNA-binding PadR family transcriptional regulator